MLFRSNVPLPDVAAWQEIEQLNYEKESLGIFWSGHPIDRYAADLQAIGAKTTADLVVRRETEPEGEEDDPVAASAPSPAAPAPAARAPQPQPGSGGAPAGPPWARSRQAGEDIGIGGIVASVRQLKTKKGDRMCVFMLDDAAGSLEIVVFPDRKSTRLNSSHT